MNRFQGNERRWRPVGFLLAALLSGCRSPASPAGSRADEPPSLLPGEGIRGEVVRVNAAEGFVILQFEGLILPDETLRVLRGKEPVAELRVTGPIRAPYAAADILSGEPRRGDRIQRERERPVGSPTNKEEP